MTEEEETKMSSNSNSLQPDQANTPSPKSSAINNISSILKISNGREKGNLFSNPMPV
jgi:hypothetical protein